MRDFLLLLFSLSYFLLLLLLLLPTSGPYVGRNSPLWAAENVGGEIRHQHAVGGVRWEGSLRVLSEEASVEHEVGMVMALLRQQIPTGDKLHGQEVDDLAVVYTRGDFFGTLYVW
eukprot:1186416-Prorocentrum_minimum.AAC.2